MFRKSMTDTENVNAENNDPGFGKDAANKEVNTILKGTRITGNIDITGDLKFGGEIEGNITSKQDSNIVINGICRGNVETGEGDVDINGELQNGNITAGRNVSILGKFNNGKIKENPETREENIDISGEFHGGNITAGRNVSILGEFNGGEVKSNGKVYVNGKFNGKLECNEIEIGPNARGKGELFYKEQISISRGAEIEAKITRTQKELMVVKDSPENNLVDINAPAKKELSEAK